MKQSKPNHQRWVSFSIFQFFSSAASSAQGSVAKASLEFAPEVSAERQKECGGTCSGCAGGSFFKIIVNCSHKLQEKSQVGNGLLRISFGFPFFPQIFGRFFGFGFFVHFFRNEKRAQGSAQQLSAVGPKARKLAVRGCREAARASRKNLWGP